jgi:hypothetical protein
MSKIDNMAISAIVDELNHAMELDPVGFSKYLTNRFVTTKEMAESEHFQCGRMKKGEDSIFAGEGEDFDYRIGFLGILNGIFMPLGWTFFCDHDEETNTFTNFHALPNEVYELRLQKR